ncbi:MAG TPA: hypothetical protein VH817_16515 [Thermoleophilaceae bacterium]
MEPVRRNFARFLRIYAGFFLGISALVLVAFGIGVLPSGGVGAVVEGLAFLLAAVGCGYLAVRVVQSQRK